MLPLGWLVFGSRSRNVTERLRCPTSNRRPPPAPFLSASRRAFSMSLTDIPPPPTSWSVRLPRLACSYDSKPCATAGAPVRSDTRGARPVAIASAAPCASCSWAPPRSPRPALRASVAALPHDVRELVPQHALAVLGVRRQGSAAEVDVLADGDRFAARGPRHLIGRRRVVDPDVAEVASEPGAHPRQRAGHRRRRPLAPFISVAAGCQDRSPPGTELVERRALFVGRCRGPHDLGIPRPLPSHVAHEDASV